MGVRNSGKPPMMPALCAMLAAADQVDPAAGLIPPFKDNCRNILSLRPVALAVLRVAAQIELDPARAMYWYRRTGIAELGHLTAAELVGLGRAEAVIRFLHSIRDGRRD